MEAEPVAGVPGHIMGWRRERGGAWPGFFPFKRRCRGRSHFPFSSSSSTSGGGGGGGGRAELGVCSRVRSREGTRAGTASPHPPGPPQLPHLLRGSPFPEGPRCPLTGGRRTRPPSPSRLRVQGAGWGAASPPGSAARCSASAPAAVPGERRPLAALRAGLPRPRPAPCPPHPPSPPPPPPCAAQPRSGRGRGSGGQGTGLRAAPRHRRLLCGVPGGQA